MDLKKIIIGAVAKEATSKILPMESDKPKVGWKTKAAGVLAGIAAAATMLAEYLK